MLNARTRKTGLASRIGSAAIGLIMAAFPFPTLAQNWPTTDWEPFCGPDIRGRCSLDDPGVEVFLHQLSEASKRFEAMGFLAPAIDPMGIVRQAYPVNLVEGDLFSSTGKRAAGLYFHNERRIDLDYTYYFAMGAETETGGLMFVPSHELFHAIQFAYPGTLPLHSLGDAADWVIEGSAVAAELALSGHTVSNMGTPWLDSPLDQFRLREPIGNQRYISYLFWLYIADTYGDRRPDGFGILHDFFLGLENQAGRGSSIAMVDGALRGIDPEGLYNIYPSFIARHDDQQRYENVVALRTRPTGHPRYTTTMKESVDPVSARAFLVEVAGIVEQEHSGASEVEIRLEAYNPDALHLIVGDTRYDEPGTHRNVFFADIGGEALNELLTLEKLFVRVVNAARSPDAHRPQDFELIVTVYHEYILVQGTGGWGNSDGQGNEVLDSPISFSGRIVGQYWGPLDPESHTCRLVFNVADAQGSGGGLSLLVNGSLAPGEYPVAPLPPDHLRVPFEEEHLRKYPGMATSSFMLALENEGEVSGIPYVGHGGVLTIDTITPRWITGSARVAVEIDQYMGDDFSGAYNGAPRAGPRYAELQIDFSFPNMSGSERYNVASCIGE